MEIIHLHYQVNKKLNNYIFFYVILYIVGADLGTLLNLIHKNLKDRSKLAIAQKDYKLNSKF
jgi:hypothetical protein